MQLAKFLKWAKKYTHDKKLSLNGFWTNNEYFSLEYITKLVQNDIIVINEDLGKEPKPDEIDTSIINDNRISELIKEISAQAKVDPWYYKNEGKLMTSKYFVKHFRVKDESEILNNFPLTYRFLKDDYTAKEGEIWSRVFEDWYGTYFLELAALTGNQFKEVVFTTEEMYHLRDFLLKEKPKACVISYFTCDIDCGVFDVSLGPLLDLFAYDGIDYLKLLFVSGNIIVKNPDYTPLDPSESKLMCVPVQVNKIYWILAYVK